MKKITLILALFLSTTFVFGQFAIGPKVGFNTSKLTTNLEDVKTDFTNNFNFGVFVRLGKKIYIQPEINWITKGGVFKDEISTNPFKQEIKLKTIEIPVLIGWRIINLGVGNIRILAGPSASIVTDKKIETKDEAGYFDPIKDSSIEDLIWGLYVGGGVDILMFTLDVKYQFGLNEVIKESGGLNFNSKNDAFNITLGWKILG